MAHVERIGSLWLGSTPDRLYSFYVGPLRVGRLCLVVLEYFRPLKSSLELGESLGNMIAFNSTRMSSVRNVKQLQRILAKLH